MSTLGRKYTDTIYACSTLTFFEKSVLAQTLCYFGSIDYGRYLIKVTGYWARSRSMQTVESPVCTS